MQKTETAAHYDASDVPRDASTQMRNYLYDRLNRHNRDAVSFNAEIQRQIPTP